MAGFGYRFKERLHMRLRGFRCCVNAVIQGIVLQSREEKIAGEEDGHEENSKFV